MFVAKYHLSAPFGRADTQDAANQVWPRDKRGATCGAARESEHTQWRYLKMTTKMIAPALAVLLLASSGAAYAKGEGGDRANRQYSEYTQCEHLAAKFDKLEKKHMDAKHLNRAKDLRTSGMEACQTDDYLYGIHSLQQALLDIGVTPPSVNYF
jgi:hypothetical protein